MRNSDFSITNFFIFIFDDPSIIEKFIFTFHMLFHIGFLNVITCKIDDAIFYIWKPLFAIHITIAFYQGEACDENRKYGKNDSGNRRDDFSCFVFHIFNISFDISSYQVLLKTSLQHVNFDSKIYLLLSNLGS